VLDVSPEMKCNVLFINTMDNPRTKKSGCSVIYFSSIYVPMGSESLQIICSMMNLSSSRNLVTIELFT